MDTDRFIKMKSELESLDDKQLKHIKHEVDKLLSELDMTGRLLSDEEYEFVSKLYTSKRPSSN